MYIYNGRSYRLQQYFSRKVDQLRELQMLSMNSCSLRCLFRQIILRAGNILMSFSLIALNIEIGRVKQIPGFQQLSDFCSNKTYVRRYVIQKYIIRYEKYFKFYLRVSQDTYTSYIN